MQACLQEDFWTWDPPKTWKSSPIKADFECFWGLREHKVRSNPVSENLLTFSFLLLSQTAPDEFPVWFLIHLYFLSCQYTAKNAYTETNLNTASLRPFVTVRGKKLSSHTVLWRTGSPLSVPVKALLLQASISSWSPEWMADSSDTCYPAPYNPAWEWCRCRICCASPAQ